MYTKYSDGSIECSACIRAIELIKIANEIFKDKMQYVKVSVRFDPSNEDADGIVKLSAIPSPASDDVKTYPTIEGMLTIDIDDDEY